MQIVLPVTTKTMVLKCPKNALKVSEVFINAHHVLLLQRYMLKFLLFIFITFIFQQYNIKWLEIILGISRSWCHDTLNRVYKNYISQIATQIIQIIYA